MIPYLTYQVFYAVFYFCKIIAFFISENNILGRFHLHSETWCIFSSAID